MADDIIKNVNPNIRTRDLGDGSHAVATKDVNSDAQLAAILALVSSGLARGGTVTAALDATHFRVSALVGMGSTFFRNWTIYVLWDAVGLGAAPQDERQVCSAFNSADATFTHPAFTAQLAAGDKVLLLHPSIAFLDVAVSSRAAPGAQMALTAAERLIVQALVLNDATPFAGANIGLIKTQTDKLAGAAPVVGSTTANWNTAIGTSGEAGEDLVTIGADGVKNKVLSLVLDISALTAASVVTVKMFQQVNGVEKKVYSEGFVRQAQVQGSEPDGLWIISGSVGIHEALRVEVYSSTNESVAIGYDYMLEVM